MRLWVMDSPAQGCDDLGLTDGRPHDYHLRQVKRLMRTAQNKKRSKATSAARAEKNETLIVAAHQAYWAVAQMYLDKARQSLARIEPTGFADRINPVRTSEIEGFMTHAGRPIDPIHRRVILGEVIAHGEKVFDLCPPTEWISKGKAGVPVERGVKVCIVEDPPPFILPPQVMQKQTDEQVAVAMVTEAQKRFPSLNACRFDKGFHSPANQIALKAQLDRVALPRKGRLRKPAQEEEQANEFVKARRTHSAVASAINGLEVQGLDVCPDHGITGFKRYVALAVRARNIHRMGEILWQRDKTREQRKSPTADRDTTYKLAA